MYALLISGFAALAVFLGLFLGGISAWGWALLLAALAFLACNGLVGYVVGRRVKEIAASIQGKMTDAQRRMQEKTMAWRHRPPGSLKQAQIEIGKLQHAAIADALAATSQFERYRRWTPLLSRQIATMRMQLNYQDKNWKAVDELIPKCLAIDPLSAAMVIARTYMRDGYRRSADKKGRHVPNDIDRAFRRSTARLRYGQGALLFGLYAWILNREGDADAAFAVLLEADRKMENATIKRNIDLLRNNKPKQFSLAGLGDEWYALGLEEPRIRMPRNHERPF